MKTGGANSWQAIQTEVLRRINAREWTPGELIPSEAELAEEFSCARATVNRALRELADTGVLERRRKAGTRVALHPIRKATLSIPVTRLEVEQRGAVYGQRIISFEEAQPPALIRSRLNLSESTPMLHARTLHLADKHPFLYEARWVNLGAVPDIRSVDFTATSINEWLVQHARYTHGDITFSAANLTEEEAELLAASEGSAAFIIDRTTYNGDVPITSVRLVYAPGYRMHTTL